MIVLIEKPAAVYTKQVNELNAVAAGRNREAVQRNEERDN